eukprot:4244277-Amphidinium_carterae.1
MTKSLGKFLSTGAGAPLQLACLALHLFGGVLGYFATKAFWGGEQESLALGKGELGTILTVTTVVRSSNWARAKFLFLRLVSFLRFCSCIDEF